MPANNVISFIFESAWAITEQSLEMIISIANRENNDFIPENLIKNEGVFRTSGSPLNGTSSVWMRGSVAVIPVIGPIFPRANLMTEISGATSIQRVTADFQKALQSKEVRSIIFYIDSPGGQVTGVQELASLIYESRAIKPIKGYVYGQGASAAYNIVSATSEIISADTAIVGSIGVLSAVKDTREKDRKEGVRTVEFVSSVSPNKTLNFEDDKSLSKVQRMVDALGKVMVENIARFRGVSSETILQQYGQGDVFVGQTALDRRLVDRIGTFESLVNEMDTSSRAFTGTGIVSSTITKGGGSMDLETLKSQHPDVYNAAVAIGKQEAEASFAGKLEAARADGAKAERERIQNIESIKVPGAQAVIEKMKFDPKATKESVAVAVLEDQQKRTETAAGKIGKDAQALANQVGQVATGQEEGTDTNASAEEKAALDAMVDGINKK
jgi:ClpP class serine protease